MEATARAMVYRMQIRTTLRARVWFVSSDSRVEEEGWWLSHYSGAIAGWVLIVGSWVRRRRRCAGEVDQEEHHTTTHIISIFTSQ